MSLSFLFLWGSFDFQSLVMSYYYTNYMNSLSNSEFYRRIITSYQEKNIENMDISEKERLKRESESPIQSNLKIFEDYLKEYEERLLKLNGYDNITNNYNDQDKCLINIDAFIKNEYFDNYPDFTATQKRKYNLIKRESLRNHLAVKAIAKKELEYIKNIDSISPEDDSYYKRFDI